ncbi:MAG: DUF998 domain-containing protein [Rhodoglobus sp.]
MALSARRAGRMRKAELAASIVGCLMVVVALAVIWAARLTVDRELYVSELGAEGMPTADWFERSLLLIVAGGSSIAWAGRHVRSGARVLRAFTPAISLWTACGFFLLASQVTCTPGCPIPYGDTFVLQDFIHTLAAVLAFAATCWAMLQTASVRHSRLLARSSLAIGTIVAVVAATGGLMSLFRFYAVIGSRFEFIATSLAIAWLVLFGVMVAVNRAHAPSVSAVD